MKTGQSLYLQDDFDGFMFRPCPTWNLKRTVKQFRGGDVIVARELFKEPCEFVPQFSMIMQTNTIPRLSKVDSAIIDTMRVINFPFKFSDNPIGPTQKKQDRTIKERFERLEYRQQFMLMLIKCFHNEVESKKILDEPTAVKEKTSDYFRDGDIFRSWLSNNIKITGVPRDKELCSDVLADFRSFARFDDGGKISAVDFGRRIREVTGITSSSIKGERYYRKMYIDQSNRHCAYNSDKDELPVVENDTSSDSDG